MTIVFRCLHIYENDDIFSLLRQDFVDARASDNAQLEPLVEDALEHAYGLQAIADGLETYATNTVISRASAPCMR